MAAWQAGTRGVGSTGMAAESVGFTAGNDWGEQATT
jgi:hypothetical protein